MLVFLLADSIVSLNPKPFLFFFLVGSLDHCKLVRMRVAFDLLERNRVRRLQDARYREIRIFPRAPEWSEFKVKVKLLTISQLRERPRKRHYGILEHSSSQLNIVWKPSPLKTDHAWSPGPRLPYYHRLLFYSSCIHCRTLFSRIFKWHF